MWPKTINSDKLRQTVLRTAATRSGSELAVLWGAGAGGLVSQLSLLHPLRQGDLLPRTVAVADASRRIEKPGHALSRHSRGR